MLKNKCKYNSVEYVYNIFKNTPMLGCSIKIVFPVGAHDENSWETMVVASMATQNPSETGGASQDQKRKPRQEKVNMPNTLITSCPVFVYPHFWPDV